MAHSNPVWYRSAEAITWVAFNSAMICDSHGVYLASDNEWVLTHRAPVRFVPHGLLFNDQDQIIGMNFAIIRDFCGSNFALPVRFGESPLKRITKRSSRNLLRTSEALHTNQMESLTCLI